MIRIALLLLMLSWQLSPRASHANSSYALTQFQYDDLGRLIKTIDPLNRVTEKTYRDDGVVTAIQDPEGKIVTFEYDGNKRRTALVDPSGNRTEFVYDGEGRVKQQTDPLGKKTKYQYDPVGNLQSVVDRLGRERGFVYDGANRLIQEGWINPDGQVDRNILLQYDARGNLVHAEDRPASQSGLGIYDMAYDTRNRLSRFHGSEGQGPEFELSYSYDEVNRTQTVKQTDGAQVISSFDERGQLQDQVWKGGVLSPVKVHLNRNAMGDVTEALRYADATGSQLAGRTAYEFGRARQDIGAVPAAYLANGDASILESFKATEAFGSLGIAPDNSELISGGSDPLKRITKITHQTGLGQDLMAFDYGFDEAGQLHTESKDGAAKTYGYDPRGQLTSVTSGSTPIESYSFDESGNRTADHRTTNYTVVANNRITADGTWTYGYDDEGNLISKTGVSDPSLFIHYNYDHRNRIVSVTKSDGSGIRYAYDFLDRRVYKYVYSQSAPLKETHWRYNGDQIWLELKQEGNQSKTSYYLSGEALDQWVARQDFDQGQAGLARVSWYLTDRMGSIRAQSNNSGVLSHLQDYDSFGKPTAQMASGLGFTGREWDEEAGLYYYRARYYDANLGRFTSEDPIKFRAGDFNLGRYVANNPLGDVDAFGLSPAAERGTIDVSLSARIQQCLGQIGLSVATDYATTGLYLLITAEGGFYVGQSVDVERRVLEHVKKFTKFVYEPFYMNSSVDKTQLRNLEEYLFRLAKEELGEEAKLNKINPRSAKKFINPCD